MPWSREATSVLSFPEEAESVSICPSWVEICEVRSAIDAVFFAVFESQ
jgi:hypothetical protein